MNSAESSDRLVREMLTHLKPPIPFTDQDSNSKIARFYANRSVFITGATGFIGKFLIEKLIRSCWQIKHIYVLVREKRGKRVQERLLDLIKSQCFDKIREAHNGSDGLLTEKLRAIRGDITLPKFGICKEDKKLLSRECSIVFNSAATIRFSEPIEVAVKNNICSVGQLVEFCNDLENLKALIHLSTAYSNCHKSDTIYEIFYEPPIKGSLIQEHIEKLREIQGQIHVYPELLDGLDSAAAIANAYNLNKAEENANSRSLDIPRSVCKLQRFYKDGAKFPLTKINSKIGQTFLKSNGFATSISSSSLLLQNYRTDYINEEKASQAFKAANCDGGIKTPKLKTNNDSENHQQGRNNEKSFDLLEEFTRIALRRTNRPNTYTFTKAISENFLLDNISARPDRYLGQGKIPVAIIRPSIVCGSWREPIVGFVDNYNGPTGAILALYTGALQAMPGEGSLVADLVPIDMVTNMILTTGWYLASGECETTSSNDNEIKLDNGVYLFNFVSGFRNPLNWQQVTDLIAKLANKYPSKYMTRLPGSYFVQAGKLYDIYDLLYQKFPAYLVDLFKSKVLNQKCEGRSSALVGHEKIKQMTKTLTPFTTNQWLLSDANVKALYERLDKIDKNLFHFDVTSIDWNKYISSYIIGSRIYAMGDEASNVSQAMKFLQRRRILVYTPYAIISALLYFFLVYGSQLEAAIWGILSSVFE